jgi:hypothetical protein
MALITDVEEERAEVRIEGCHQELRGRASCGVRRGGEVGQAEDVGAGSRLRVLREAGVLSLWLPSKHARSRRLLPDPPGVIAAVLCVRW